MNVYEVVQKQLETVQGRVLFAVEAGSRAWGLESADSDYDIRFVYVKEPDWYMLGGLRNNGDTVEWMHIENGVQLDFAGWDLQKALLQFRKPNPQFMEWVMSPINYGFDGSLLEKLRSLTLYRGLGVAGVYHYFNMARKQHSRYLLNKQIINFKKYFYVLRPVLCMMFLEKHPHSVPPVGFDMLVERTLNGDTEMLSVVSDLVERKRQGNEPDFTPAIPLLDSFLLEKLDYYEGELTRRKYNPAPKVNRETIEELFLYHVRK